VTPGLDGASVSQGGMDPGVDKTVVTSMVPDASWIALVVREASVIR